MIRKAQHGYILLLTTFIIATCLLLISLVVSRVSTYKQLTRSYTEKEIARLIARSGIDIAMSQLMIFVQDKKEEAQPVKKNLTQPNDQSKQEENEKKAQESAADFILKKLNTWQTFDFEDKHEGLEATCNVYITSEQGKINLNNLYDFKEKKFKQLGTVDGKKALEFLTERLKPIFDAEQKKVDLANLVEQIFQKNNGPFEDISQLAQGNNGVVIYNRLFPSKEDQDKITFFELFTTSQAKSIHPLALTSSMKLIAGFKKPGKETKEKPSNEQIDNIINKQINDWKAEWDNVLSKIYGQTYDSVPETIKSLFANKFEPNLFFVVSYGKVGSVTEKVAALIEKNQTGTNKNEPFIIRKLYWL